MCWEALNNIAARQEPARDRGQRQRPLLRADHRRPGRPPRHAAAQPRLREGARPGQGLAGQDAARRRAALRGAARGQEGHQGRGRARRPCSRTSASSTSARSTATTSPAMESALRRAKAFGGPVIVHAVTRKGYGYQPAEDDEADCLHSPSAFDPETGRPTAPSSLKWTTRLRRRAGRDRRRAPRHRRHHRRDARVDRHLQARRAASRTAPSTSASPSSTPPPRPPGWRWAACTRWWRSTRRSSTAPSTRCCSTWPCTGCR